MREVKANEVINKIEDIVSYKELEKTLNDMYIFLLNHYKDENVCNQVIGYIKELIDRFEYDLYVIKTFYSNKFKLGVKEYAFIEEIEREVHGSLLYFTNTNIDKVPNLSKEISEILYSRLNIYLEDKYIDGIITKSELNLLKQEIEKAWVNYTLGNETLDSILYAYIEDYMGVSVCQLRDNEIEKLHSIRKKMSLKLISERRKSIELLAPLSEGQEETNNIYKNKLAEVDKLSREYIIKLNHIIK